MIHGEPALTGLAMEEDLQADLEHWLASYLEGPSNKTRRRMCPAYIAGLTRPGDRKSIQPMAARSDAISYSCAAALAGDSFHLISRLAARCSDSSAVSGTIACLRR
mgnify:CR=1 FL=1